MYIPEGDVECVFQGYLHGIFICALYNTLKYHNIVLTCCITQYLVSICGRTARVTVLLLHTHVDPTPVYNHTRTKMTMYYVDSQHTHL